MGQFSFSHLDRSACIFTLIKAETLGFQPLIIEIISQASPVLKESSLAIQIEVTYITHNQVLQGEIDANNKCIPARYPHTPPFYTLPAHYQHTPPLHLLPAHYPHIWVELDGLSQIVHRETEMVRELRLTAWQKSSIHREREGVCVCVRERECGRVCTCVCEREMCVCVCFCVRQTVRVRVCVHETERVSAYVYVRERERERVYA